MIILPWYGYVIKQLISKGYFNFMEYSCIKRNNILFFLKLKQHVPNDIFVIGLGLQHVMHLTDCALSTGFWCVYL